MSSANSSTETPALIRRTFDWERKRLLKGTSRLLLRTIFWVAAGISISPRRTGQEPLSWPRSVTKIAASLSLSWLGGAPGSGLGPDCHEAQHPLWQRHICHGGQPRTAALHFDVHGEKAAPVARAAKALLPTEISHTLRF